MASQHLVSRKSAHRPRFSGRLDPSGPGSARLAHLCGMETTTQRQTADRLSAEGGLDPVITLSQLAVQLGVSVQTLYDLRSQGRGPRRHDRLAGRRPSPAPSSRRLDAMRTRGRGVFSRWLGRNSALQPLQAHQRSLQTARNDPVLSSKAMLPILDNARSSGVSLRSPGQLRGSRAVAVTPGAR